MGWIMQRHGYFKISNRENGSFLVLYPPNEGGQALKTAELDFYFTQLLIEYPKEKIGRLLANLTEITEIMLSKETLPPIKEMCKVSVDTEKGAAILRFYAPSEDGAYMDEMDIRAELVAGRVKYGIEQEMIDQFLKEHLYCTDYVMAKSLPVVEGTSAEITYHFNTNLTGKPKMNEDGSVDFHELDVISPVEEGALLATLKPAVQGTPGMDVYGQVIKPITVKVLFLKQGRNIRLSEDGLALYSMVNGHASLVDGQVFVSDNYEIANNVDASTGNIKYSGNITIQGNVNTGYRVEATGDIIVNGVVEGAYLISGGQIILKRGIQGMGRGVLEAKTNVISKFIESAEVHAGGAVTAEAILHSKVYAKGDITVKGKRGFISGGEVKSATAIIAKTVGSVMGTITVLEVGIDPHLLQEFHLVEKQVVEANKELASLTQQIALVAKKMKSGTAPKNSSSVLMTLNNERVLRENVVKDLMKKMESYDQMFSEIQGGCVLIDDVLHPGCKVTISNTITYIRKPIKHSRLVKDEGEIRVKAY